MAFCFRGERRELKAEEHCLALGNTGLIFSGKGYPFHRSTLDCFGKVPGMDLCRSLSFRSMADHLCFCYNTRQHRFIEQLICAVYLAGSVRELIDPPCGTPVYQKSDRISAYNIALKIFDDNDNGNAAGVIEGYNELLYVLNNALSNLRLGISELSGSMGGAPAPIDRIYDPIDWVYDPAKECFIITDPGDVLRLDILLKVPAEPPVITFYTGLLNVSNIEYPILYSSSNRPYFPVCVIAPCPYPVALLGPDGSVSEPISCAGV